VKMASGDTSDWGMAPLFVFIFYARPLTRCFDVRMKREKESHEFQLQALTVVIECLYSFVEINNSTRDEKTI
jgi:hypothetical protein